ncbi:protein FAR1-RELATED SEQUENCE 5-like [Magnolia sinica]|uniref:protein FAR1-RELATED SEQUENCE 5-like n=1 Tax=Magnolia sinica TaxID=86752 RepID=UPI002659435B|nr:protein FAR1-RELATED SEQUENCE 5-like [Magnolia sinica]
MNADGEDPIKATESCEGTVSRSEWIPEVEESKKPIVGKTIFSSLEEAYEFYNNYARCAGFSVRKCSCKYASESKMDDSSSEMEDELNLKKNRLIVWKRFVCAREGNTDQKAQKKKGQLKRRRGETRDNCPAVMIVAFQKSISKYIVKKFIEVHSHDLATPRKKHLLNSHRMVTKTQRSLQDDFQASNIKTTQTMAVLSAQLGGYENIGCTEKDLTNYERDKRQKSKGCDAQMLYEHFEEMKELHLTFEYEVKVDEENSLLHCFWADHIARQSYKYFGDVIVFDTTYNTNRYGLIFAPFTGVNHHGQSITLGCGFIHDETTESFIWLFESWRKAMQGKSPKAIITDQDPAMTKAISIVFPNTFHRYCIWHIMQKVPEKLGAIAHRDEFIRPFNDCVWNSQTSEDFEDSWEKLMTENGLEDNVWLNSIYAIRHKWIPAFVRHVFFAGMSSSQRSESMNAFFRSYISKRNSFIDFIVRFDRALARQRHNELAADHETISSKPKLKMPCEMEKVMGETYTRRIFYKF